MTDLAVAGKASLGIRRFLERAPEGAQHLRLVARSDPPMTLASLTVGDVRKGESSAWADLAEQMADHSATQGCQHFLIAWVGERDSVLASKPVTQELPERPVHAGQGAQQLALQLDGSVTSQLAQMQKHSYDMTKLYIQAHAAQMAQAITLLDKYSERTLTAIEHETRLSAENAELRAEVAELSAKLDSVALDSDPSNDNGSDAQAQMLELLKPAVPALMARLMQAAAPSPVKE